MPILPNARHELFCQALSQGMTQEQAYIAAKYKQSSLARHHASRLATKEHIRIRVTELQTRNITRQDELIAITTESLLAEAEAARCLAMELEQPAAAIAAITAKGKLAGVWLEKSEQTVKGGDLNQYSDSQLAAIIGQPKEAKEETSSKLN